MERDKAPKPPMAGIIYGEIAYWVVLIGMIVAVAGLALYMTSGGYISKVSLLDHLWQGADSHTIWVECSDAGEMPEGHWYLAMLSKGDALAMLGISIACLAGVAGTWGALFEMVRSKGGIYIGFVLIAAVVLTLSALGIISLEH